VGQVRVRTRVDVSGCTWRQLAAKLVPDAVAPWESPRAVRWQGRVMIGGRAAGSAWRRAPSGGRAKGKAACVPPAPVGRGSRQCDDHLRIARPQRPGGQGRTITVIDRRDHSRFARARHGRKCNDEKGCPNGRQAARCPPIFHMSPRDGQTGHGDRPRPSPPLVSPGMLQHPALRQASVLGIGSHCRNGMRLRSELACGAASVPGPPSGAGADCDLHHVLVCLLRGNGGGTDNRQLTRTRSGFQ